MKEKIKTNDLKEKKNYLISLSNDLKEIVKNYSDNVKVIEGDNSTYFSPSSVNYLDHLKNEINKINEFLLTLDDAINFLEQVSNKYDEVDNDILEKLNEIGDVV